MNLMQGDCQGCGQAVVVKAENQRDADIQATKQCGCPEGAHKVAWWDFIRRLANVCRGVPQRAGFKALTQEVIDAIQEVGHMVHERQIDKVQIHVSDSTITIQMKDAQIQCIRKKTMEIEGDEDETAGD